MLGSGDVATEPAFDMANGRAHATGSANASSLETVAVPTLLPEPSTAVTVAGSGELPSSTRTAQPSVTVIWSDDPSEKLAWTLVAFDPT